jgi:NAD(P)-dependent dehydrogenase (short-subunit alcohol dehydrogenase family)
MEASITMIGQKIVVVGGTAGIGLAVTRNAADCGAEVYIGSSNAQKLQSTFAALQGVRGALVDVGDLARTLPLEVAPGRVNTVSPGFIDSGKLWKDLPAEQRESKMRDKADSDLLTVGAGLPDDAAKSYLYVIQNPYVTGQTIVADGGASLT